MSTTLTNGLKLPDKGSVDWYADMQNNYNILDGAVGTIAEHTTQIAGKANAVHTHTKSDVTDLLNSNFIPSANNSYDLGSSSYQWNNLYAKNYYYNGTAWGLDKANTWTGDNTFNGSNSFSKHQIFQAGAYFYNSDSTAATSGLNLRNSKVTKGGTSDSGSQIIQFLDKDNKFLSQVTTAKALSGTTQLQFILGNIDSNNNSITGGITFSLAKDGTKQFIPGSDSTHNLGNGSYKWKSLNGINPGALSLPDFNNADPIDTRNWVANTPTNNTYTPSESGWLNVVVADSSPSGNEFSLYIKSTNFFASAVHKLGDIDDSKGKVGLFIPVIAGITYYVVVKSNTSNITISATLYPCFGSV